MRTSVFAVGLALLLAGQAAAQHFPPDSVLTSYLAALVEEAGAGGIVLGLLEADGTTRIVSAASGG